MITKFLKKNEFMRPVDILVQIFFSLLSVLVLVFHQGLENWWLYILMHIVVMISLFYFVKFTHHSKNKILQFLRNCYPLLLYTMIYKELSSLVLIIHDDWLDRMILSFEYSIFRVYPSVFLQRIAAPWFTEILKFSYFSYYLMIFLPPLYLYFMNKQKAFNDYVETITIAFFICYIGFILFPARGPRYELEHLYSIPLNGYFFTRLQDYIMANHDLYGGCLPSSHIAVACAVLVMFFRYMKKVFYVGLPIIALLCFSTVYQRYHYVSDVIAGFIVCWFALYLRNLYNETLLKIRIR